jgi:uncharacterized Tic20 family protein
MVILHAALALLAGFALITALVMPFTVLLTKRFPAWVGAPGRPRPAYLLVNLVYSFLAAAAGGYLTACIATGDPLSTVLALAIVVLAMSAISTLDARGRQPLRYQIALAVISPIGVVIGGLLRLKVLGLM